MCSPEPSPYRWAKLFAEADSLAYRSALDLFAAGGLTTGPTTGPTGTNSGLAPLEACSILLPRLLLLLHSEARRLDSILGATSLFVFLSSPSPSPSPSVTTGAREAEQSSPATATTSSSTTRMGFFGSPKKAVVYNGQTEPHSHISRARYVDVLLSELCRSLCYQYGDLLSAFTDNNNGLVSANLRARLGTAPCATSGLAASAVAPCLTPLSRRVACIHAQFLADRVLRHLVIPLQEGSVGRLGRSVGGTAHEGEKQRQLGSFFKGVQEANGSTASGSGVAGADEACLQWVVDALLG